MSGFLPLLSLLCLSARASLPFLGSREQCGQWAVWAMGEGRVRAEGSVDSGRGGQRGQVQEAVNRRVVQAGAV